MPNWDIQQTEVFEAWYFSLRDKDRQNVLASLYVLEEFGPHLSSPYADKVNGSRYANMKELRIQSAGRPIRVLYAFDPERNGLVLCGGHKDGPGAKRFYREQIEIADREFTAHLASL